jgi:RHS repeat-associated protein
MSNTFDAANRLITTNRATTTLQVAYNGVGDRVAQTVGTTTTQLALDVQGLPEVIYTNSGESYLHLPGVIMTEKAGQRRYLLPDGLGSIRQAISDTTQVVAYYEFDPYGNPVNNTKGGEPYGYTGEWWAGYINLLHLRARWYAPETGTFLSRDPVESEPPYLYVRGNPINLTDPSGRIPDHCKALNSAVAYEHCVLDYYNLEAAEKPLAGAGVTGSPGCFRGPIAYKAQGYFEGFGGFGIHLRTGVEIVYDFATMERRGFWYGYGDSEQHILQNDRGINDSFIGFGLSEYAGLILGFRSDRNILQYQGPSFYGAPGVSTEGIGGVGEGFIVSTSPDFSLTSVSWYVGASLSADPIPVFDWDMGYLYYVPGYHHRSYVDEVSGKVNLPSLINDISSGNSSPWPLSIPIHGDSTRFLGVEKAISYA